MWQNKQEEQRDENREDVSERKLNYIDVSVVCVSSQLHIYAHHLSEKKALEELQKNLQGEFVNNPSVCYSKERPPQKGSLPKNIYMKVSIEKITYLLFYFFI